MTASDEKETITLSSCFVLLFPPALVLESVRIVLAYSGLVWSGLVERFDGVERRWIQRDGRFFMAMGSHTHIFS